MTDCWTIPVTCTCGSTHLEHVTGSQPELPSSRPATNEAGHDRPAAHRRWVQLTHGGETRGHNIPDAITSMILTLAPHLLDHHDYPEAA